MSDCSRAFSGVVTAKDGDPVFQVVSRLLLEAQNALAGDRTAAMAYISQASRLLSAPMAEARKPGVVRGGLAQWQIDRLRRYIDTSLVSPITQRDLAEIAGLSCGYFSRAFKKSFGEPPHSYIVARRIARAQHLLLTTDAPLCQVALDCGLADQAHLSRLFRRLTGETPSVWRRKHVVA